jgi:poly(A) polymerase
VFFNANLFIFRALVSQRIYSFEEHRLCMKKVDSDALCVMQKLRTAGYIAYLVGGSVRDLLLHKNPKDFDICTSAQPEEIKKIFRNCILVGKRFRLAHIRFGKKILEVSTFRSGDNELDELIVRDNKWGTAKEDALRRDFTINALFYDSDSQSIIDYTGGFEDIKKQTLRTIGQPFIRFRQDPVRMLRMLKFQARFGFTIDDPSHIALLECRQEIMKSSPVRILEELLRMLESKASEPFFRLLAEHGFMHLLMPSLGDFLDSKDAEEVFSFLKEIDHYFMESNRINLSRAVLLAALVFPFLEKKIYTRYVNRNITLHLGQINKEVHELLNEMFCPFIHLSRRLRTSLQSILVSQYRITPLDSKKLRRIRIPQDPDFIQAMQFFEIRCALEPTLKIVWEQWNYALTNPAFNKRRRRKKKIKTDEAPSSSAT